MANFLLEDYQDIVHAKTLLDLYAEAHPKETILKAKSIIKRDLGETKSALLIILTNQHDA